MEEITFQNKREDLEAYHDYMLKETEEGKQIGKRVFIARSWFAILMAGLFFLLIWGIRGYLGASIQSTVFLAIGFVLLMIFVEGFVLLMMGFQPYYFVGKQVLKKNVRALTEKDFQIFQLPRTIKLNEAWLEIRNSEAVHRWRWGLVDSIGLTSNFIYLHIGKCFVFYVPKREFPSEEDFLAFGKKLVELTQKNRDQPLTTGSIT